MELGGLGKRNLRMGIGGDFETACSFHPHAQQAGLAHLLSRRAVTQRLIGLFARREKEKKEREGESEGQRERDLHDR